MTASAAEPGPGGSERRRATPRARPYNSGQKEDFENAEELRQLCWRPSSLMGKQIWPSQLKLRSYRQLRTACTSQGRVSDRECGQSSHRRLVKWQTIACVNAQLGWSVTFWICCYDTLSLNNTHAGARTSTSAESRGATSPGAFVQRHLPRPDEDRETAAQRPAPR